MAYDIARGITVIYGGRGRGGAYRADTWEWDGARWVDVTSDEYPPGRSRHAMVYDSGREVSVMFGGWNDEVIFGDTWEYRRR
jgi:hypothetical protein